MVMLVVSGTILGLGTRFSRLLGSEVGTEDPAHEVAVIRWE
jgi:hypothetical protein